MFFDGETITVASIYDGRHIYDTIQQPGDVNESLDFMVSQTGWPSRTQLFSDRTNDKFTEQAAIRVLLGKSTINGVSV